MSLKHVVVKEVYYKILKERAKKNGRLLQAEINDILEKELEINGEEQGNNYNFVNNDPLFKKYMKLLENDTGGVLTENAQRKYDNFYDEYYDNNGGKRGVYSKFQDTETWKNMRAYFIVKKIFNEGFNIRCDYCHEIIDNLNSNTIINSYKCTLHHNFGGKFDYGTYKWDSLFAPIYINVVHHKCHQKIHGYC